MKHLNSLAALALSVSMGFPAVRWRRHPLLLLRQSLLHMKKIRKTQKSTQSRKPPKLFLRILRSMPPKHRKSTSRNRNGSRSKNRKRKSRICAENKKAVAAADMEELADLCGYPVCITLEYGDSRELETREDFTALGADTLFTQSKRHHRRSAGIGA